MLWSSNTREAAEPSTDGRVASGDLSSPDKSTAPRKEGEKPALLTVDLPRTHQAVRVPQNPDSLV